MRWLQSNRQAVFNLVAGTGLFVVSVRGVILRGQLRDAEQDKHDANAHRARLEALLVGSDSEWRQQCASALGLATDEAKATLDSEMNRAVSLAKALGAKDAVTIESLGGTVPDQALERAKTVKPAGSSPAQPKKPSGLL
jgi:hypothetical protein